MEETDKDVIGNDGDGGKEMVRSSGGRSFQRRSAVMDMARFEMTSDRGRERLRQENGLV